MRRGPGRFGTMLVAALLTISAAPGQITASSPSPAMQTVDPAATTPNVRVTDARGTLVPSIPDADGSGCTGPWLELRFTITNLGATDPIADELVETQSIPLPPEGYTLLVLAVWIDQHGTGENMAQQNVPVLMDDVPGGTVFIDHEEPGVGILGGWNGLSTGPVPAGGVIQVDGASPLQGTRPFDRDRLENGVQVIAACPDGSSGDLSDGNRADNVRTLRQAGQPAPTAGS